MSSIDAMALAVGLLATIIALWAAPRGYLWIGRITRIVAHVLSVGATAGLFERPEKAKRTKRGS